MVERLLKFTETQAEDVGSIPSGGYACTDYLCFLCIALRNSNCAKLSPVWMLMTDLMPLCNEHYNFKQEQPCDQELRERKSDDL